MKKTLHGRGRFHSVRLHFEEKYAAIQPSVSFNLAKTSMQGVKCSISRHELHNPGETNSTFPLSKVLFSGGKEHFLAMFCFSSFIYSWIDYLSLNTHIIDKVLKTIYYPRVAQTWAIVTLLNPLLQVFWTSLKSKCKTTMAHISTAGTIG